MVLNCKQNPFAPRCVLLVVKKWYNNSKNLQNNSKFKNTKKFDMWEQRTMKTKINGLKEHNNL